MVNNMYAKLPVSSLESRAQKGNLKACAELIARSKAGLKRATLALERLGMNAASPVKPPDSTLTTMGAMETPLPQTLKKVTAHYSTTKKPLKCSRHKKYFDFECAQCNAEWSYGFIEPDKEERKQ